MCVVLLCADVARLYYDYYYSAALDSLECNACLLRYALVYACVCVLSLLTISTCSCVTQYVKGTDDYNLLLLFIGYVQHCLWVCV